MKRFKQKCGWVMGVVVAVLIVLPFFYFGVAYWADKLKYKKIENYYYANTESFDSIVKYFEGLYKENLYGAKYDCDNTYYVLGLEHADESGEIHYTSENVECTDTGFIRDLSKLREKYQKNCDYPIFSTIYAYYDKEGNMLLHMQAYNEKINEEERRNYYLVYIEDGYSENSSFLGIDSFGIVNREPFTDNWYTWSMDWPFG